VVTGRYTLTSIDVSDSVENMSHRPRRIIVAVALSAALTGVGTVAGQAALGSAPPSPSPSPSSSPSPSPSVSVPAPPTDPVPPTATPPNPSPYPPTVPTGLTATAVHANSVTLSWTASRPGCCSVDHYVVTYSQAFDDVIWSTNVGNVTSATVTGGINARQQYRFQVSAVDAVNHQSAASTAVTLVTPASDTAADQTPPGTPAGLTITGVSPAGVGLSWSPATDDVGVVGYNVYRFDGWFSSVVAGTTTGTTFTAPTVGARDSFYVRARDAAGNVSIASNTVTPGPTTPPVTTSPTPPAPPCGATYHANSVWAGGFVADVTVTNTGPVALDGWTIAFTFGGDQRITSSWNGNVTQSGAAVTVTPATWNRKLAPGATTTVGLMGSWTSDAAPPASVLCSG
jgi:hypothetical protein